MPRSRTPLALLGAALLLDLGCAGLTGGCTYRIRSTEARGSATVEGRPLSADVLFFQTTDPMTPTAFQVGLGSSEIATATVTLTLVDSRRPAEPIVRAEVTTAEVTANRRLVHPVTSPGVADRIFDAVSTGSAVLLVDGPGGAPRLASLPLQTQRVDGWTRPRCD